MNLFLKFLNDNATGFVLKGGTALHKCYGLDRFSEDIDLDTGKRKIDGIVKRFCTQNKLKNNEKKNTSHGQRFMIEYGKDNQKLKIETSILSSRKDSINSKNVVKINGITTYNINFLSVLKLKAFLERDKIRDMYDVCFIVKKYWDKLSQGNKELFIDVFEQKNYQHCQRLIDEQNDQLISEQSLENKVLDAFEIIEKWQNNKKV